MSTDTPVLDTLADMTTASVEHNSLSPRDFMMARLAAMIAVDAPPSPTSSATPPSRKAA